MPAVLRSLLVHRCAVKRSAGTSTSRYGKPMGAVAQVGGSLACRFEPSTTEGGTEAFDAPVTVAKGGWRVWFASGADVQERDVLVKGGVDYMVRFVVGDVAGAGELMEVVCEEVKT